MFKISIFVNIKYIHIHYMLLYLGSCVPKYIKTKYNKHKVSRKQT